MNIMCGKIIFHHTPKFFLWLENVVILNYNKYSKLTFTQKIEEPLSTRVSACLEASIPQLLSIFDFFFYFFYCSNQRVIDWKMMQ